MFFTKIEFRKEIDNINEVIITPGGQAAINYVCFGFLEKGDEVILIEPFYS